MPIYTDPRPMIRDIRVHVLLTWHKNLIFPIRRSDPVSTSLCYSCSGCLGYWRVEATDPVDLGVYVLYGIQFKDVLRSLSHQERLLDLLNYRGEFQSFEWHYLDDFEDPTPDPSPIVRVSRYRRKPVI
jgi:hypothetical protein